MRGEYRSGGDRSEAGMILALARRAQAERDWPLQKLREPFAGTTVVVTHHVPPESVAQKWADDRLTPVFVCKPMSTFEFRHPVYGHSHVSLDHVPGRTRIVSNPRGYCMRDGSFENHAFNPLRPRYDSLSFLVQDRILRCSKMHLRCVSISRPGAVLPPCKRDSSRIATPLHNLIDNKIAEAHQA